MSDTAREMPSYAQYARTQYEQTVEATARRLRDAVDKFERAAMDTSRRTGLSSDGYPHATAAQRAVYELHTGLANAHVDSLLRDAAEADHAIREDQSRG